MFTLSDEQSKAVSAARKWYEEDRQVPFKLAGFAGSGKSAIAPYIAEALGLDPARDVRYVAPTGKAALVMSKKLQAAGVDAHASTIHKAIYRAPWQKKPESMDDDDWLAARLAGRSPLEFQIDLTSNVRHAKLIICDEASMVGQKLADDLNMFEVPIIAIGDPGQLQPIDSEPGFDMQHPDAFLAEIHRQARDNPIIRIANEIRCGVMPTRGSYGSVRIVPPNTLEIPDRAWKMPMIIVGTHKKRWALTKTIRDWLGFEGALPQTEERLICCKNSKFFMDLVNGTEAIAAADAKFNELDDFAIEIKCVFEECSDLATSDILSYRGLFDEHIQKRRGAVFGDHKFALVKQRQLEHFDFGWAITCHKSQGSQWDDVLVIDESHVFPKEWKNWLYTACTRAVNNLTIITD